jgi:hypothetical protein
VEFRQKLLTGAYLRGPILSCIAAVWFIGLALTCAAAEEENAPTINEVKADVLLNLSRYIEWPEGVFMRTNSPILFGIYGNTALVNDLKKLAQGRRINGREVIVRQYNWPIEPNCQLLYIADTEKPRLANILRKVQHSTVLTVSELPDFTTQGGMVQLIMKDRKAHFAVNVGAATNVHLKVSARLLNVADGVR